MQYIIGNDEKKEQVIIHIRQNKTIHKMYKIWKYYKRKFGNPMHDKLEYQLSNGMRGRL